MFSHFRVGDQTSQLFQAQFVDIVCLNHYYGWYTDTGVLNLVSPQLTYDVKAWYDRFQKPVIITEYGADTIAGLHTVRSLNIPCFLSRHISLSYQ